MKKGEPLVSGQPLLQVVVDTLPVGVVVMDRGGDIVLANAASKRIWGGLIVSGAKRWAESKGFWHSTGERLRPNEWASVAALSEGKTTLNEVIDIETYQGQRRTIQNSAAPIRDASGSIVGAVIVNEDVTERMRGMDALRESERILREAEQLGHTGSWEQNLITGEIVNTAENLHLFFGDDHTKGTRLEDYADVVHPDDREFVMRQRDQLHATGSPRDIEYRVVWPDGSLHWLFGRATVVRDDTGKPIRVHGTNVEITERKRAEEALQEAAGRLQQLSHRLLEVQEEERRHLARELHDEFGQLLATITLLLHAARNVAGEAAQSRLEECAALLRRAGDQVRSLALELRPPMLDTAGLEETLRWLAEQYQQRTGIRTEVTGHVHDVSGDVAIVCFRVAQEALTNVLRHARAEHVWIELSQSENTLELAVRDDGVGFDVAPAIRRAVGSTQLGLLGMRERAQNLGGTFEVRSQPGQGTRVRMTLPLTADSAESAAPEI